MSNEWINSIVENTQAKTASDFISASKIEDIFSSLLYFDNISSDNTRASVASEYNDNPSSNNDRVIQEINWF